MSKYYITKIIINKLRHLENIEIDLSDEKRKHLLLTGKNGVGKTTTLNYIKKWLKSIEEERISTLRWSKERMQNLSYQLLSENNEEKRVYLQNEINKQLNYIKDYGFCELDLKFSIDEEKLVPIYKQGKFLLAYYGANRKTEVEVPMGVEKVNLKDVYSLEESPSNIFIKYLVDLKTQQSFARNEDDLEVVENIEYWFNRFEKALRCILDDESIKLKFNYKNYNFSIIQDNRESYGLNELSDGYSSIINIISDLILRMDKNRASEEKNYTFDTEGIVLIDELETHLHIGLQKKILPFLTEFFPNIQFIITTHSPFVLSSIDNSVIYDLEKKIKVKDLSNYSYEGIVEGYFNVDKYSEDIKAKLDEYEKLAYKKELSDYERAKRSQLRIELKEISSELAIEMKLRFEQIEMKRLKLNDKDK